MTQIVEIRTADDPRDVIHCACQLLAEGQLVAFPTETTYVAAAGSLGTALLGDAALLGRERCQCFGGFGVGLHGAFISRRVGFESGRSVQ